MCKQEDTEGRLPKGGRGLRDEVQTGELGGERSRKKQWRPPPGGFDTQMPCDHLSSLTPTDRGELGQVFFSCFYNPQTLKALTHLSSSLISLLI